MLPTDILALQRIVAFTNDKQRISDIMMKLKERADKRQMVEIDILKGIASEFKSMGYSL